MINTYITVLGGIQTHDPGSQAWKYHAWMVVIIQLRMHVQEHPLPLKWPNY